MASRILGEVAGLKRRDLLVQMLTISSGAIDVISFLALGKVFTAFMTGNVAFLGLRIAGADGPSILAVLVSMIAFAVGVSISARIVEPTAGVVTWPRQITVALGLSLLAHVGFLATWVMCRGQPSAALAVVLIGFWAVAMGMQSAAVRKLHIDGIFTTAATATVIDLVYGIATGSAKPGENMRFASVIASLLVGAIAGALLLVHARIYAPFLPFVITILVVSTAAITLHEQRGESRVAVRARA